MNEIDLGHGHYLSFTRWAPDRDLNPRFAEVPDIEKFGASIRHKCHDGTECKSAIEFDGPEHVLLHKIASDLARERGYQPMNYVVWQVHSWEPLTLTPSLLCKRPIYDSEGKQIGVCGDHGHITNGKWIPA